MKKVVDVLPRSALRRKASSAQLHRPTFLDNGERHVISDATEVFLVESSSRLIRET